MPVQEYKIAPELRRCCWYVIIGTIVILGAYWWLATLEPERGTVIRIFGCTLFAVAVLAMVYPFRWRLRVDEDGITRKRLIGRDTWSWADLASGRIHKLHSFTLFDPSRPWWRCRLDLSCLASDDAKEVFAGLNLHYQLPPPPKVPDTLTFRLGLRSSVTFDEQGIHLCFGRATHDYRWQDVRNLHMKRMDPKRRDIVWLFITLPDREIELPLRNLAEHGSQSLLRPRFEGLNELLVSRAAPEKIDITIVGEPLRKRKHITQALRQPEQRRRAVRWMLVIFVPLLAGTVLWSAFEMKSRGMTSLAGIYTIIILFIIFIMDREPCRRIAELKKQLNSVSEIIDPVGEP